MPEHIRPFRINVAQEKLDWISAKLALSHVGYAPADDAGWKYGADAAWLRGLLDYWRTVYDWRQQEAKLNEWSHFLARIDDLDIHFIHMRATGDQARLPLILTHGWPGSFFEFTETIIPLTEAGFDVVIPSLPGYGFSSKPPKPIGPRCVAALWRKLMTERLGYNRFGAQGGDWGSAVTRWLGHDHADVVAAIHLNLFLAPADPSQDDEETKTHRETLRKMQFMESAYMMEQATKPQTIGLALADTPLGFAAWVAEKFQRWGDTKGDIESRFPKDKLLTNIMIYLVNDAVQSAIWMYNSIITEQHEELQVRVPTGCALFPAEFYPYPPRQAAERIFNIVRWTNMRAGGHFAAMEEPVAFAAEVAAYFTSISV